MITCECNSCTELEEQRRLKALDKWNSGIHEIEYKDWEYTCGDGCCYEYGTNVFINGYQIADTNDCSLIEEFCKFLGIDIIRKYSDED